MAMRKNLEKTTTPFTPAISLIRALHKALEMIREEGPDNVFARHAQLAEASRAAMKAIGLKLVSECPANGVTAVWAPDGVDTDKLNKKMRDEYGVTIAGGQGWMKGKIFRIGHMGYVSKEDLLVAIASVERALKEFGYKFEFGAGLAAAHKVLFG
jgi:aspartate aminotransferase-like enzyme